MRRLISSLLCFAMFLGSAGCAVSAPPAESRSDEAESVTLDWYVNYSWYNTPWGGNAVSETITEKTGVDIRFIPPDGSESETLDALIAGGSLPDLVTLGWWETQLTEIVDGGMAYPLNELADQYDPSFWTVADQRRLAWYARPDGNTYCYPNSSYTPEDYQGENRIGSNQTFLVRQDIYEAIGSPDMTTPEGFADAVRSAAERFPTVDGKPLIPIGAHEFTNRGCDSFDLFLMNFLAIPYEKDGRFYDRYTDPEYKRWLAMFRQLGEEGLLANDIFIDKRAQMEEKLAEGRYFCMIYQRTDLAEQQRALYEKDPGGAYIAIDGPRNAVGDPHTLPGTSINGWTVTLISKNCAHPDKAIRLMSFLMGEEGQKLIALGIEGEHYQMVDGRAELTEEVKRLMRDNLEREGQIQRTELRALQNQINAHFIYNVLEAIKMMAEIDEEYEIADAVTTLGKLLRYSMKLEGGGVRLERELDYIRNYVALMNLRFDYVIGLETDISLELMGQPIPKVSLQPIVENAVIHGAAALAADSTITLTGACDREKGRFTIRIADQGRGMGPEELERLRRQIAGEEPTRSSSGNGIGLKNVQDRIQMAYGRSYGLQVESQPGGGTAVTISFPFHEATEGSP